jgi:phage tail-like protein
MVRPVSQDFLHSMRFHVSVLGTNAAGYLQGGGRDVGTKPEAGFSACSTPEASLEAVEYKEGNFVYTRKYAGVPTVSDITMSRGVARQDSSFWGWMKAAIEGGPIAGTGTYREDIQISHYHRDRFLEATVPTVPTTIIDIGSSGPEPGRRYTCRECFPIRHKTAADLDATASEISIMELDVSMEYFEVEEIAPP